MMTLERSISSSVDNNGNTTTFPSDRQYHTLPIKRNFSESSSPTKNISNGVNHLNGVNHPRILDRSVSNRTYTSESSITGFSNTAWASTSSIEHNNKGRKSRFISRNYNLGDVRSLHRHWENPHAHRHERITNGSPGKELVDSHGKRRNSHLSTSSPASATNTFERSSKEKTPEKATTPQNNTCSREVLLEFPSSMPRSAGRSSHSSAAKRSEKSKELRSDRSDHTRGLKPARSMPGLAETSPKDSRPHSADARPRERKSCALFFLFRRKKKTREDRSPSPERSHHHYNNTRGRPKESCATPQSVSRSERKTSPSHDERRPSSHSSSRPLLTPTSSKPPKTPTTPTSSSNNNNTDKNHHYNSRSRPQHRGERRHQRTNTPASRTQSEDRLRYDDLPPHPSLYKKASEKTVSNPNTPCLRSNNHRLESNSRPRGNSDSVSNVKSAAVSSTSIQNLRDSESGQYLKDSLGDSAQNLADKSQHSTSKTDLEDESHYHNTSSSEHSSRRSVRSQSLPSFGGGDPYQIDAKTDTKVISDAEDFEYSPTDMKGPLNLSLCGCGFLGMYHLGVVTCLAQRGPSFLERVDKVAGASAGALMAAVLVTSPDKMEESGEHIQNLAKEIRRKPLGALTPGYSFTRSLRYMLDDILPNDAHEQANGKLFVSLTNSVSKKNELMSDFKSKDELIEALVASCYIPVYAGIKMPTIRGKKYFDGGLSDNMPRFESGRTITVSPFDGKSDIGPKAGQEVEKKAQFINFHNQDLQVTMNNVRKGAHAFFPPKRHVLQEYFEKGRYDASRFLIREGLYEINVQQQKKKVVYESSV